MATERAPSDRRSNVQCRISNVRGYYWVMTFDLISETFGASPSGETFLSPRSGARGRGCRPPRARFASPWATFCRLLRRLRALAQVFRSSAFPANELPGYGFAGLGGGDSGRYEQICTVLDCGTTSRGTYPQIQMSQPTSGKRHGESGTRKSIRTPGNRAGETVRHPNEVSAPRTLPSKTVWASLRKGRQRPRWLEEG